jgi:hypothetical protein
MKFCYWLPNGVRYLRAGVDNAWEQDAKRLEATLREMLAVGAAHPMGSPTRQVHALLGSFL